MEKCIFITNVKGTGLETSFEHCDEPAIFEWTRTGSPNRCYCGKHADILLKTGEAKNGELKRMAYEK